MVLGFLYLIGPIGLYLVLAALPQRGAVGAILAASLLLLALWLLWPLGRGPFTGDAAADGFLVAAVGVWTLATVAAGIVQAARTRLAARGRLAYPLAVVAVLAVILLTLAPILGL